MERRKRKKKDKERKEEEDISRGRKKRKVMIEEVKEVEKDMKRKALRGGRSGRRRGRGTTMKKGVESGRGEERA